MTTQLRLYQGALRKLGERTITALTDDVEARHRLDDAYNDGLVDLCLSRADWNFAERTATITGVTNTGPGYGYTFAKPTDWVRTIQIATDDQFANRLEQFEDAPSQWEADVTTIYVRYVSNGTSYGGDLTLWPENFAQYVEWTLAEQVAFALTNDHDLVALVHEQAKLAFEEAVAFNAEYTVIRPSLAARQLRTYKGALRKLGAPNISRIPVELHYRMTEVWEDGFVDYVLTQGQWNFAIRTSKLLFDPSIDPDFGYQYGYNKPTDWIRTVGIASDEYFTTPLEDYEDETTYWFCDLQELYVRYISNDQNYGTNYNKWPESFQQYVEWEMACQILPIVADSQFSYQQAREECRRALHLARNVDAMNQPNKAPVRGQWTRSRATRWYRDDFGNRIR